MIYVIDSPLTDKNEITGWFHGHLQDITKDDRAVGEILPGYTAVCLNDGTKIVCFATPCNGKFLVHFEHDPTVLVYIEKFGTEEKVMDWLHSL